MTSKAELRKQLDSLSDQDLENLLAQVGSDGEQESAEDESKKELSEVLKGIKDRTKQEAERRGAATDGEFWAQLIFQSQAQRDAFFYGLAATHLLDDQWVDGQALAKHLQIPLPEAPALALGGRQATTWNEFVA